MLKSILFGLIALQFGTLVLSRPWDQGERNYCLERQNEARLLYANEHKIANMNYLEEYNMDLENIIIEEMSKYDGCPEPTFIKTDNYEVYLNMTYNTTMLDEKASGTGRTKAACYRARCEKSGEDVYSVAVDTSSARMLYGEPASRCPKDRSFIHFRRLCGLDPSSNYARKSSQDSEIGGRFKVYKPEEKGLFDIFTDIDLPNILADIDIRDPGIRGPEVVPTIPKYPLDGGFWKFEKEDGPYHHGKYARKIGRPSHGSAVGIAEHHTDPRVEKGIEILKKAAEEVQKIFEQEGRKKIDLTFD